MNLETLDGIGAAVAQALAAADLTVYRNSGPEDPEAVAPYCVVYPQPPILDGPSGDPHDDAVTTVQVKSVGNGFGAVSRTADRVRAALLAGIIPPAGRVVSGPIDPAGGQPAIPDPDGTTRLWMADEFFRIPTTPLV